MQKLRAYLAYRQGLLGNQARDLTNAQVLEQYGWARSVGGCNGYITLFSRNGCSREDAEREVKELKIHEFASARGCTYILPQSQYQVGIKAGQGFNDTATIRGAKSKLGATDEEIQNLCDGMLVALADGPLDTGKLKAKLGDLVITYGEAGKKLGLTNNMSLGLLSLQAQGKIRRIPTNGRLDQQSYAYTLFTGGPDVSDAFSKETAYQQMADLYWEWIGVASLAHFQWFSGLSMKAVQTATAQMDLVPFEDADPATKQLIRRQDVQGYAQFEIPSEPDYRVVTCLDSLVLLRRDLQTHLDPADHDQPVMRQAGLDRMHGLQDLPNHAIVDRGRVVGLWEFDAEAKEIVHSLFVPRNDALDAALSETEAFVRDQLGDARSYSLDSPKTRMASIAYLRSMSK